MCRMSRRYAKIVAEEKAIFPPENLALAATRGREHAIDSNLIAPAEVVVTR